MNLVKVLRAQDEAPSQVLLVARTPSLRNSAGDSGEFTSFLVWRTLAVRGASVVCASACAYFNLA